MSDARTLAYGRRRARTRAAITGATLALIHEIGFDKLTTEEIVTRAGCSRAAFYLHFESKSHAVVAALDELWVDQDSLTMSLGRALRAGTSRTELIAALQVEMSSSPTPAAALYNATRSDSLIAAWFFREQDRAFDLLLGGVINVRDSHLERVRARFHILGEMTLSAMASSGDSSTDISADETIAYLAELWIDLLERLSGSPRSSE